MRIVGGAEVDEEGFLLKPHRWNLSVAEIIAKEEGIAVLTERHLEAIAFIRKMFMDHGKEITLTMIKRDAGIPIRELYTLFPKRPLKKATRIAGVPKPSSCV